MSLKIDPFGINNTGFIIGPFGMVGDGVVVPSDRGLKVGSTTVESVYLGSSQFTHVYSGPYLVWSQT